MYLLSTAANWHLNLKIVRYNDAILTEVLELTTDLLLSITPRLSDRSCLILLISLLKTVSSVFGTMCGEVSSFVEGKISFSGDSAGLSTGGRGWSHKPDIASFPDKVISSSHGDSSISRRLSILLMGDDGDSPFLGNSTCTPLLGLTAFFRRLKPRQQAKIAETEDTMTIGAHQTNLSEAKCNKLPWPPDIVVVQDDTYSNTALYRSRSGYGYSRRLTLDRQRRHKSQLELYRLCG